MAHAWLIQLKAKGGNVTTLRMEPGGEAVTVGRSNSCSICTPPDDRSVSGVHARLYWKGKNLYLEDKSRNGIICDGRRLSGLHKVAPGDMFAIGENMLICDHAEKAGKKASSGQYHRLERLNGDAAGQQIDIVPRPGETSFTIGRADSNTLVLQDDLVSKRHVEIDVRENGECWLRDLGSSNETYVNGEPLRDRERLLKDNDKITIAYFDFQFLDRSVRHARFFLWLKLFAVAATLSVMAGAYVILHVLPPSPVAYLREGRRRAAECGGDCNFDVARTAITEARRARDADSQRLLIDDFEVKVDLWEKTCGEWKKAKQLLSESSFTPAKRIMTSIVAAPPDAWTWNSPASLQERVNAIFIDKALLLYFDIKGVLDADWGVQPEALADEIKAKTKPLADFIASSREKFAVNPCFEPLSVELSSVQSKMDAIRQGFERVEGCIAKFDAKNPDFARLVGELDDVIRDKTAHVAVRAYADKYKRPCSELAEAKMFIRQEFDDLNAMRFVAVKNKADSLKLPSKELCARHGRLSDYRVKLEGHHADAQTYAANLDSMVGGLAERGVVTGECGAPLKRVLDLDSWKKALSFACFDEKPPSTRRKDPSGFYDELLGVDFTYQSLRSLPENYSGSCLRLIGFSPDVVEARKTLEYIAVFEKYLSERPAWLRRGELGAFYEYCRGLLDQREKLRNFLSGYRSQEKRAQLVTEFYAGWLGEDFSFNERKKLAERFRALQREVSELCERYSLASDPMEQIGLRAKILGMGLPGDALLHPKWVQKFEGGVK